MPNEFSVDGNEPTPTMMNRRKVVNEKYVHLIDELFSAEESSPV